MSTVLAAALGLDRSCAHRCTGSGPVPPVRRRTSGHLARCVSTMLLTFHPFTFGSEVRQPSGRHCHSGGSSTPRSLRRKRRAAPPSLTCQFPSQLPREGRLPRPALEEVLSYHPIDEFHPYAGTPHAFPQVPVIRLVQAPRVEVVSQEAQVSTVENRGVADATAVRRVRTDATPDARLHFHFHDAIRELPPTVEARGQQDLEVVGGELVVVIKPRDPPSAGDPEGFVGRRGPRDQPLEIGILRVFASGGKIVEPDARIASVAKQRFRVIRAGIP